MKTINTHGDKRIKQKRSTKKDNNKPITNQQQQPTTKNNKHTKRTHNNKKQKKNKLYINTQTARIRNTQNKQEHNKHTRK